MNDLNVNSIEISPLKGVILILILTLTMAAVFTVMILQSVV